jgi:predicted dehydrogenase
MSSKVLNYLVIGIGDITRRRVIPAIQAEPRSALYGILTRDPAKAAAYPEARVFPSLEQALADEQIDVVYVGTPVALHAPQTLASLRAGKHVLCEKPLAMNLSEADSMVAAAEAANRLFAVAYYRRLYPKLLHARRLIADGAIGQPTLLYATHHGWLESEERLWLRDPAMAGGGPLYDVASHRIDAADFLFGQPVRATGFRSNQLHRMQVEDNASILIDYASGPRAIVDVRWNSRVPRDEFRILGTEGELNLSPLNAPEYTLNGASGTPLPTHSNTHFPAIENFTAAVLDGTPLSSSGSQARWTDWVTEQVMNT